MLKKLSLGVICFFLFSFFSNSALAGGWFKVSSQDPVGDIYWKDATENTSYNSPHGGFTSSSNLCRTCHAVHEAGENSWRLLKNGNTTEPRSQGEGTETGMGNQRETECMYCHDASSGLTNKKPYEATELGQTVRGEHTLGATSVPDSDINGGAGGSGNLLRGGKLGCYQCHSVHGAQTINSSTYNSSDAVENWNSKILRLDPAGDGSILAMGSGGLSAAEWEAELLDSSSGAAAVRTGFCADCHTLNPNWARTTDDNDRPNKRSHPQGRGTDSLMEVYGEASVPVAAHPLEAMGCRGCHWASANGVSRFPHQSVGWKLLYDEYTTAGASNDPSYLAGDPQRVLPNMDEVCLSCHAVFADLGQSTVCLFCHDSRYGAPDIGDEIRKTYGMDITDAIANHSQEYGNSNAFAAPASRHAACSDCHNAQKIFPWTDTPLTGIWGVGVTNGTAGSEPVYAVKAQVDKEYELCFKCHSGWTTQPTSSAYYSGTTGAPNFNETSPIDQGNKGIEFNPANSAYHPVEASGRNFSANLNAQLITNGLPDGTATVLNCTDCHNNNAIGDSATQGKSSNYTGSAPTGPHGSTNKWILRANYNRNLSFPRPLHSETNFSLCFSCHNKNKLLGLTWYESGGTAQTNFWNQNHDPYSNLHKVHVVDRRLFCADCHYNVHSNQQAANTQYLDMQTGYVTLTPPANVPTRLVNFAPHVLQYEWFRVKPEWGWNNATKQRSCNLRCHRYDGTENVMNYTYTGPPSGDLP